MKKIIIIFFTLLSLSNFANATDIDILDSQKKALGISDFINTSQKYTQDVLRDLDIKDVFEDAITGRIGNTNLFNNLLNLLGRETKTAISNIGIILIVIVLHSILVTISESLGNKSVSQIAYFVEYIVIITLVLNNFADIINMVKNSIIDLVGFSNSLIPLMITLMLTTGSIVSAGVIKPLLLILMNFIGNFITNFILPIVIIGTSLAIISKISNNVRIDKLGKFMKSVGIWILGTIMTLFVTILSLEGSITETVDRSNSKNCKGSYIHCDTSCWENIRRCNRCCNWMCWNT